MNELLKVAALGLIMVMLWVTILEAKVTLDEIQATQIKTLEQVVKNQKQITDWIDAVMLE